MSVNFENATAVNYFCVTEAITLVRQHRCLHVWVGNELPLIFDVNHALQGIDPGGTARQVGATPK